MSAVKICLPPQTSHLQTRVCSLRPTDAKVLFALALDVYSGSEEEPVYICFEKGIINLTL